MTAKYKIEVGNEELPITNEKAAREGRFTFDSTTITFDSLMRTFDEN